MILKEFKSFLQRSNIVDLAAAVVMGSAFTQIVSSFVSDLLNPFLTLISRDTDLRTLSFSLGKATFNYGAFLQATINFFTIALFLFIFIKIARKIGTQVEQKVINPVDEKIIFPLETKFFGRKREEEAAPDISLNKDNLISQVQEDLKNKRKRL